MRVSWISAFCTFCTGWLVLASSARDATAKHWAFHARAIGHALSAVSSHLLAPHEDCGEDTDKCVPSPTGPSACWRPSVRVQQIVPTIARQHWLLQRISIARHAAGAALGAECTMLATRLLRGRMDSAPACRADHTSTGPSDSCARAVLPMGFFSRFEVHPCTPVCSGVSTHAHTRSNACSQSRSPADLMQASSSHGGDVHGRKRDCTAPPQACAGHQSAWRPQPEVYRP